MGHDVFPSREMPDGKLSVGLGGGGCREVYKQLFCLYAYEYVYTVDCIVYLTGIIHVFISFPSPCKGRRL